MSKQSTQFNCFSPPVMIVTVIIELFLALYGLWRYKMNTLLRLVTLCLLSLAIFQICEYNVCTGPGIRAADWARLGYVFISVLPPLGLHIMHVLAGKPGRKLVVLAYMSMAAVIVYFLTYRAAFAGYQCTGNYVIFQIGVTASIVYGVYYYGWLMTALVLGARWANQALKSGSKQLTKLRAIQAMMIGYLVFIVPTAIVYSISPSSRRGIPSIMCGFAVLFALILALYILPLVATKRQKKSTTKK